MTNLEHAAAERAKLYSERTYWEGVRRNANFALQDVARDDGAHTNNAEEQLKAQLATAIYQLDRIAQELNRLDREREAEAREEAFKQESQRANAIKNAERREQEAGEKQGHLKEEIAKEERLRAETLRKDEQQKAEALEKECPEKESFEKEERERLEALVKEERDKQELEKQEVEKQGVEKQEALKQEEREKQDAQQRQQSDLDFLGEQLTNVNKDWQYIQDQIASEWDYVDKQIQEEMEYNVGQALEAVAEAGFEIGIAIANPVSQREAGQYLGEQKQQLNDFISDEVFQAAPAENKKMWLEAKFKEQQGALKEEFGDRKDDWGNHRHLQDGLAKLQQSLLDAVKQEQQIETKLTADVEALKKFAAETKERLEAANLPKEVLEEKTRQVEERAKELEKQLREQAEKERQAIWERVHCLLQEIEAQRREEAAREEARRREEAARAMRDTFGF